MSCPVLVVNLQLLFGVDLVNHVLSSAKCTVRSFHLPLKFDQYLVQVFHLA